jgi:hypothetical protein
LSAKDRSLALDAAVSAVSLPEKKAESIKRPRIAITVIQKAVSFINDVGSIFLGSVLAF